VAPAATEAVVELVEVGATEIAGLAFPWMLIICGELAASSVRVMVSLRWPAANGAKVTEIAQEAFVASASPEQLLAGFTKSVTLLPPITSEEICRVALPELVMATFMALPVVPCVMALKVTGFGAMVTAGAGGGGATPVPLSCTDCGLPGALGEIWNVSAPPYPGSGLTELTTAM
jgi:hypothetical protein